ncbi:putative ATP-dependent RNA helicase DHR1, partial [Coemansia erecta]
MGTNKSKKEKRFGKFVEKQVKKEERVALLEKLSTSTWKSSLMRSSKTLGRNETRREKLQRAMTEERLGMSRSDPNVRLYVSERDAEEVQRQADAAAFVKVDSGAMQTVASNKRKRNRKNKQKNAEGASDQEMAAEPAESAATSASAPVPAPASASKPAASEAVTGSGLASTTVVK